jgi:hypothetical protein
MEISLAQIHLKSLKMASTEQLETLEQASQEIEALQAIYGDDGAKVL